MGTEVVCFGPGDDITGCPHRKERIPTCAALSRNDSGAWHTAAPENPKGNSIIAYYG